MTAREATLWRPALAVLAGVLGPAAVAYGLLQIAGAEGPLDTGDRLRRDLLLIVYALAAAPLVGLALFPVLWAVFLALAMTGWAGLLGCIAAGCALGLAAVHIALHGDLTAEAPGAVPHLAIALATQAATAWAVFWTLARPRRDSRRAAVRAFAAAKESE